jgi:hypothetical protein
MRLDEIIDILEKLGIDDYTIRIRQKELYIHKQYDYCKLSLTRYVINKDGELYIEDYKIINDKFDAYEDDDVGEDVE